MMRGFLPPSSMVTFFTESAQALMMILPTSVLPVKEICVPAESHVLLPVCLLPWPADHAALPELSQRRSHRVCPTAPCHPAYAWLAAW